MVKVSLNGGRLEAGRIVLVTSLVSVTSQPIEGPLGISLSRPTRYATLSCWSSGLHNTLEVPDYIR